MRWIHKLARYLTLSLLSIFECEWCWVSAKNLFFRCSGPHQPWRLANSWKSSHNILGRWSHKIFHHRSNHQRHSDNSFSRYRHTYSVFGAECFSFFSSLSNWFSHVAGRCLRRNDDQVGSYWVLTYLSKLWLCTDGSDWLLRMNFPRNSTQSSYSSIVWVYAVTRFLWKLK